MTTTNYIKKVFLFLLLGSNMLAAYAQHFNYTLNLDTAATYSSLTDATILSQNTQWLPKYEIPTGFLPATSLQSITLETNGFVVYNTNFNSAIMAFKGFGCKLDSNANYSQISYTTTGNHGSKILKIEFKNVGQGEDSNESLTYQIWLRENGVFDILVGPNTYERAPGDSIIDTNQVVSIGLINRNMDAESNGLFISGTPQNPVSLPLNSQHPEFAFLSTVPKKGYKYTFTPTQN